MAFELSKPALRSELRAARDAFVRALPPSERRRLEACATARLMALLEGARCIAFYIARGSELDCDSAIAAANQRGFSVALPYVSGPEGPMRFLAWAPGEALERGWRGLVQPATGAREARPDLIVAPLLGFDSAGRRLGQGGGFYDRAFAGLPMAGRIGLAWSIQQRPVIASDPWDVPLDAVVTEADVIERNRPS